MATIKLKLGIGALVIAGVTIIMVVQHQSSEKLRAENESLTRQLAQAQVDYESLSNRLAAGNTRPLSDEPMNELLKLRGEVGALRQQQDELGKLREENHRLLRRTAPGQNQTAEMSPEEQQFEAHQVQTVNTLKMFGIAMRIYAGDHRDQFATNFDQMKDELGTLYTNLPGNLRLVDFEFVNAGLVNETMPDKIIFRERNPRQAPNGKWMRVYGYADGSVQVFSSDNGNFDAFDQPGAVLPPSQ